MMADYVENLKAENQQLKDERDQALVGEAYANGMGLAAVEAWESRALQAEAEQTRLRESLEGLHGQIMNLQAQGHNDIMYRLGHRDARHAAAELVAALSSTPTPETTP